MSETPAPKQMLTAAWVAPMDRPIVRDGAVVIRGDRILEVGEARAVAAKHPDAVVRECGAAVLLPGLVNAHVHLDLTLATRPESPGAFTDWLRGVIRQGFAYENDPTHWERAAAAGVGQCARCGVTSVGDIVGRNVEGVRAELARHADRIRVTSFGEVTGMARRRDAMEPRLAVAVREVAGVRTAVSPHAPYSIEAGGYRRCLAEARRRGWPITTHLAETAVEGEFLESQSGPFRELWEGIGAWDELVPRFVGGPIRYARSLGLVDYERASLAHVNYCDDEEMAILARGRASVVYCPRTHRYFGHPPHRWREMLACGINVAVGTDSCASSADLNLVEDLRVMHEIAPEVEARVLWEMGTVRGARAMGAADVGSLGAGKYADVVAFGVGSGEPLREVLESGGRPSGVWCGGRVIHPLPMYSWGEGPGEGRGVE